MRRALLALTAAAGLTLAACGGSSAEDGGGGVPTCESLIGKPDWAETVRSDTSCLVDDAMQVAIVFDCADGSELLQVGNWGYGNNRGELRKGDAQTDPAYQVLYTECQG